jgi:uncharacterized protein (TIGR03435 family)
MVAILVAATSLLLSGSPRAGAQADAPVAASVAFEAASIKPSAETRDAEPASMVMPGGRYVATNVTLRRLVRTAYGLQEAQVVGGPSWVDHERFDVLATANRDVPASTFRTQFRPLLATLLRERFRLSVHNDVRVLPAYALIVSRRDGKLGPRLRRTDDSDCAPPASPSRSGRSVPQSPAGQPMPCGAWYAQAGRLTGRAEFGRFVETLAPAVDRVVVDRTNLSGLFEWDLQWTPGLPSAADAPGTAAGSIFTALGEQLGLKLDSRNLRVDVLVVDRAEHLTEN